MQSPTSWLTASRVALRSPIHSTRTTGELQRALSSPPPPLHAQQKKTPPALPHRAPRMPPCPSTATLCTCLLTDRQSWTLSTNSVDLESLM